MYCFLITLSALLFSFQFAMNSGFQKEEGAGWSSSLRFSFYSSLAGALLLFCINGFRLRVSPFSLCVAAVYAAVCVALNFSSVKAFENADLSVYSVFSMIGGMVLPFLYGVCRGAVAVPEGPRFPRGVSRAGVRLRRLGAQQCGKSAAVALAPAPAGVGSVSDCDRRGDCVFHSDRPCPRGGRRAEQTDCRFGGACRHGADDVLIFLPERVDSAAGACYTDTSLSGYKISMDFSGCKLIFRHTSERVYGVFLRRERWRRRKQGRFVYTAR